MLVLSRKLDEAIQIGQDVSVKLLEIRNGQVKLGIEAPKTLPVHRSEVYRKIQRQEDDQP
jgi:carbon storage regulator